MTLRLTSTHGRERHVPARLPDRLRRRGEARQDGDVRPREALTSRRGVGGEADAIEKGVMRRAGHGIHRELIKLAVQDVMA